MMNSASAIRFFKALFAALIFISSSIAAERTGMGFRHYERVENPGTRSAGVRGVLLYQGKYITPVGSDIKTPIGSFRHLESPILFEPQGWFPVQDIMVANAAESIDSETLQKGTYKGARLVGTPEDWCFLAATNTWIAPQRLATNNRLNPFRLQDTLPLSPPADMKPVSPLPQCQQKVVRGPCKALFEVFYFDETSQRCKAAFWGGCQGVAPFKTLEDCQKACEQSS